MPHHRRLLLSPAWDSDRLACSLTDGDTDAQTAPAQPRCCQSGRGRRI